ncbi:MAG: Smr/MutS family protein [Bacteroidales bacterium]|nr:Smr/MutS family protein [Bacteroidales bacterium]
MENYIKIEQKLGFNKIKESLALRCSTDYARERVENERVSTNPKTILKRLSLTDEMRLICMFEPSFPSEGYIDSITFLKPLETESSVLSIENLRKLQIFLENLKSILAFFKKCKPEQYPNLKGMAEPILFFPEIGRRLDAILDKSGEIRENASIELYKICRSINEKENSISRKIQSILRKAQEEGIADQEATVSVRDGRMLIPVSSGNKRKLQGFVYDESASGKTVFIEPAAVVELNNEVKELYFAKQREIYRILREFSDFVRPYIADLINGARFVGEIDFIRAKGLVALQMEAGKPILSQDNELKIVKGRHPLLEAALKKEKKEIVPLTLTLNPNKHILVISGPNAGGKSVCLKTTGILQYMFQWGMLVPASEVSEFTIFDNIFIDIGDEQSIENDLSTYSSHLTNMRELLLKANNRSLVLIDEFGSGTEPAAGGAIAETILSHIESRGAYGVITTHYTNLKLYAGNSKGTINGAMLFDTANIRPLYKLETGLPGNSFAFELARKIGLPENIIKEAEERAGTSFVDMEKQLRKISRNRRQLDEKLLKIKHTDKTLENITDKYQKELEEIQNSKKQIIAEAKREAEEILSQANKKIEATIKAIKVAQAEKERTKLARKELEEFNKTLQNESESISDKKIADKMQQLIERKKRKEERKRREQQRLAGASGQENGEAVTGNENIPDSGALKVGDKVKVKGNDLIGEVLQVGKNSITISVGNITSKISPEQLERISNKEFNTALSKQPKPMSNIHSQDFSQKRLNFKPSIDIRGERLVDALDIVARFIDDALMVGMDQVKILHGKGNGILKEEIRQYLKTVPGVTSCRDEDIRFGGSGITIVELY